MKVDQDHITAILVFANSSKYELQNKPLVNGEQLFEELTQKTLKVVRKTGLPYFLFTEKQQCGNSFGERFVNALQAIFDMGYENVISVGNDTPHLRSTAIRDAHNQLESKKFVLGPSADGGFYLMGLRKANFDASEFLKLPWKTSLLAKDLLALQSGPGTQVLLLKTLFDLDTERDVRLFAKRFQDIGKRLLAQILALFKIKKTPTPQICLSHSVHFLSTLFNKGSPTIPAF